VVVWGTFSVFIPSEGGEVVELLLGLAGSIFTGLMIYGLCSYLIKSPELLSVAAEIKKGLSKK
jgi:hypothetical protein